MIFAKWFEQRWNSLSQGSQNALLFLAVVLSAIVATVALLEDSGVKAVLYQAF